jgi:hypothetical protein
VYSPFTYFVDTAFVSGPRVGLFVRPLSWHTQHTMSCVPLPTFVQNVVSFVRFTPGSVDPQYATVRCGGFDVRLCTYPDTTLSWSGYPSVPLFDVIDNGVRSGVDTPPVSPLWQSPHAISFDTDPLSWIVRTGCLYAFNAKFCVGTSSADLWQKSHVIGIPPVHAAGPDGVGTGVSTGWSHRIALDPGRMSLGFRL